MLVLFSRVHWNASSTFVSHHLHVAVYRAKAMAAPTTPAPMVGAAPGDEEVAAAPAVELGVSETLAAGVLDEPKPEPELLSVAEGAAAELSPPPPDLQTSCADSGTSPNLPQIFLA